MADRFDDIEEFDSWAQGSDDEGGEEGALDEGIARLLSRAEAPEPADDAEETADEEGETVCHRRRIRPFPVSDAHDRLDLCTYRCAVLCRL